MGKKIDLTGKRFGRLIVIEEIQRDGRCNQGAARWKCMCDCGNETIIKGCNLRSGNTKSCGCYEHDLLVKRNTKHGLRYHSIYSVWKDMLHRCYNNANKHYKDYGGRGIVVCPEWRSSPKKFIEWANENGWENGLQIDRFDNDKSYFPWNCRFVTPSKNQLNTRLLCTNNTTGFRGVSWHKQTKKYRANIQVNSKPHYLGGFKTAIEAAEARDAFVIKKGVRTPLNFPPKEAVELANHVLMFGNGKIQLM